MLAITSSSFSLTTLGNSNNGGNGGHRRRCPDCLVFLAKRKTPNSEASMTSGNTTESDMFKAFPRPRSDDGMPKGPNVTIQNRTGQTVSRAKSAHRGKTGENGSTETAVYSRGGTTPPDPAGLTCLRPQCRYVYTNGVLKSIIRS